MFFLPIASAILASLGWAIGSVLAHRPASAMGSFEFSRIQLIACSAILAFICSSLGYWDTVDVYHWPAFVVSIVFGIVIGNVAMIECLRRAGARRTELLMSLRAPIVAAIAFFWLNESLSARELIGSLIILLGIFGAIQSNTHLSSERPLKRREFAIIILLGLVSTGCQGLGFLAVKPAMLDGAEPIAVAAIRLLGGAMLISIVALWPAPPTRSRCDLTPQLLFQTILPGLIGYAIASPLLLYAFANYDAGLATVFGSLSPILVLPILWLRDRQKPTMRSGLGAMMAICGTAILVMR